MEIFSASPQPKSLAKRLQYERVAILEAVLTLRDDRAKTRTKTVYWALSAIAGGCVIVAIYF